MENVYKDGEFIHTAKRWDKDGKELEL